jgi:lysophospholipase
VAAAHPEILTGPPSWRWVIEAFKSMRELGRIPRSKTMPVPRADAGRRGGRAGRRQGRAQDRCPGCPMPAVVAFGKESAHEILREEADPVRNRAIGEIDLFLAARAQRR